MKFRRVSWMALLVCVLLAAPALSFAASKEITELQRDVALLQQQLRDLQRSQDEKLAALLELARQAVDTANKANTGTAIMQSSLSKNLEEQLKQVVGPVVGMNARMDAVSNDVRTLQQAVSDMGSLMAKMQSQLNDLTTAVKAINIAPVPPPQPGTTIGGAPGGVPGQEAPPMQATDLYQNAMRDKGSGKLELALQEYADYLKWYPTGEFAPNCQFYIGTIHYGQGNYEAAAKDFDKVLEMYGETSKTKEARLYKGRSLVHLPGHKTEGADEFLELIKGYPGTDEAKQACSERIALGLRCPAPGAPTRSTGKKGNKR
ncbi:MAG TPA: tetratricopeptide repeat protein [Candidatus Acidoferrales bacterium]|nr:tetratricopeptide repeat protein [Candidatus Acidoferrales bacterium]